MRFFFGFRGFPKNHHSFPFFRSSSKSKIGMYQTFPDFSGLFRRKRRGGITWYEQYWAEFQ